MQRAASYPAHAAYDDHLQLTRVGVAVGAILGAALLLALLLRAATRSGAPSLKLLIVVAAIAFNVAVHYAGAGWFSMRHIASHFRLAPHLYVVYYLPICVAAASFSCEWGDFVRVCPHACLASALIVAMAVGTGYILHTVTSLAWTSFQMCLFGVSTCCCQPDPFRRAPKNACHVRLQQLAMAEYVFTMVLSMSVVRLAAQWGDAQWAAFIARCAVDALGGALLGAAVGGAFALTLRVAQDDARSCFVVVVASMMLAFFVAQYAAVSPFVAVLAAAPPLFAHKRHLSQDANAAIGELFCGTHLLVDLLLYTYCVHLATQVLLEQRRHLQLSYCIFGFICAFFMRSLAYLALSPVIKRVCSALDTAAVLLNAWAAITANSTMVVGFLFYLSAPTREYGVIVLCQVWFSAVCTNAINQLASELLLRNHFATHFTADQAANVSVCLHEMRSLRVKYIYMWKMKGIMTDARWDIVKNHTNIAHTFKDGARSGLDQLLSWKNVTCPDCGRELQVQQAVKDAADFTKLSKKLINNQIRTILTRRQQFGNISGAAARLSIKIVEKCLTFNSHVHDDLFRPFLNIGSLRKRLYLWEQQSFWNREHVRHIPRKPYRARLHRFVHASYFPWLIFALSIYAHILLVMSLFIVSFDAVYFYVVIALAQLHIIPMAIQMYAVVQAYSIFSSRQGIRKYFMSPWHCLEALLLAHSLVDLLVVWILYLDDDIATWHTYKWTRLVGLAQSVCAAKLLLPKILRSIEDVLVGRVSLGYEVARAIYDAYSELELSIDFIFDDNVLLATECERWVHEDKQQLYSIISFVQFHYPNIAKKVKTRQALDATLAVLTLMLEEVRSSGYADDKEYDVIKGQLRSCEKLGRALGKVSHQVEFREILQNLAWVSAANDVVQEYLLSTCTLRTLREDEVLCVSGDFLNGIYIILSGMLRMEYWPTNEIVDDLLRHGRLPVYKYSDSLHFFEPIQHSLVAGNSIGEMAYALARPINVRVVALKPTKVYFLPRHSVDVAESHLRDPINGMAAQMWKMTCFNISVAILKALPKYEYYTQQDLRMKLESAFVPDLSSYKVFCFLDAIDDMILLEGVVKDYYTDLHLVAPCHLPRSLIKFYMHVPNPAYADAHGPARRVQSQLMIIPMPDIDKYTVMKLEIEVAELYPGYEVPEKLSQETSKVAVKENKLAGVAAIKAVTQGNHLTKFINLKK